MQTKIDETKNYYKELIDELKVDAETMTNTLMNSNSSDKYKAVKYEQYRYKFFQTLKLLEIERDNKIKNLKKLPI